MRPSFHPRLVNAPLDDPGVYAPFVFENRAILFDLGDISALSPRDILKLTHVCVSHTHMDHFVGFDQLLRLFLGREKALHLFGPRGFLNNIEGKLAGYTWNLVSHYKHRFTLHATEVHPAHTRTRRYECHRHFRPDGPSPAAPHDGVLLAEPALTIATEILDHKIDSLAFSLSERFHVNILKTGLERLNLPVGPWIRRFKDALYRDPDPASHVEFCMTDAGKTERRFQLRALASQVARITPGQKITYIADAAGSASNVEKMVRLAGGADHLFIEAPFLDEDRHLAQATHHLTARQAGQVAREAAVKQCTLFHFSPRYTGAAHKLVQEARRAAGPEVAINSGQPPAV